MTTMTDTNTSIKDQLADYAPLNAGPRPRPMPGSYFLQLPLTIEVTAIKLGEQEGIEFNLGGTTIASDANGDPTFLGEEINRFYSVNTIPRKGQRWSDALDFLRHFDLDLSTFAEDPSVENAKTLVAEIQGRQTPNPVYLSYSGRYKNPATGRNVYLKAKDFLKADGTYAKVAYRVNDVTMTEPPVPAEVEAAGKQAVRDYLKQYPVVYANLEPGFRGWVHEARG